MQVGDKTVFARVMVDVMDEPQEITVSGDGDAARAHVETNCRCAGRPC